ncbi:hypothetical protein BFW01_g600 [Lasiodiplodia theobromae]|nr:hypothetical protein BFW01_g600 [Lasiodiplodia theobromae]
MARPTPGRTSNSPSKPLRSPLQTPPPPDVTTAAPEETPNRRSSRIAARHHPPASPAPLLPRPLPAPKKPLIADNTTITTNKSPTKASGAKTPATPKRKRETSFSPDKLSSVVSKMKRGKGQGQGGGGAAGRSSPMVLKRWSHSGPPVERQWHFLEHIAGALEFIHVKNYGHRDWKPQDLLLDSSPLYYQTYRPSGVPFAAAADSIVPVVGIASFPMLKVAGV